MYGLLDGQDKNGILKICILRKKLSASCNCTYTKITPGVGFKSLLQNSILA